MHHREALLAALMAVLALVTAPLFASEPRWTLTTDDTVLTLGLDGQGRLAIFELRHAQEGGNWTGTPSAFPLLDRAEVDGRSVSLKWKFQEAATDTSNGTRLTLRFTTDTPKLELKSEWWARPGRGPVRHAALIANRSGGPVAIGYQPTVAMELTPPRAAGPVEDGDGLWMWYFSKSGGRPHPQGVFREELTPALDRTLRTEPRGDHDPIPLAILDLDGRHGVYVGIEWSFADIRLRGLEASTGPGARFEAGNVLDFSTSLQAGQEFEVPPGFVGAYEGDVDDAGNSLRRYLFQHSMPDVLRNDPTYPKVQWNAFIPSGASPRSYVSLEKGYYRLIDDIARHELGFEEVMIDVGWWQGGLKRPGTGDQQPEPDKERWPSGMKKAADYARQRGMRFGLYWTDNEDMTTSEGRKTRAERIKRLFVDHGADMWRSDDTGGAVITPDYWSVRGFYGMVDGLQQEIQNFQWENCKSGGRLKDYGAMKRSVKIFGSDGFSALCNRQTFHDSSFAFHPIQLMGHLGFFDGQPRSGAEFVELRPRGSTAMRYAFRSMSMGAPEWFIDAPNGGNGGDPWTEEEIEAVREAVATYKTKLRPLVRSADLYHIFPRPDNQVWDGIQYYDRAAGKGVAFVFKPKSTTDAQTIKLRGLDAARHYRVTFEDGSNPQVDLSGAELMETGIEVVLEGQFVSELMFFNVLD